ncbi:MAG: GerMN domain-containing protein [Christensenellales bacterium]
MAKKLIITGVAALIIIMALCGCGSSAKKPFQNMPDINPKAESANKDTVNVALYYCYNGERLLASETRAIEVPVNDSLEAAVVRAIIAGPSAEMDELSGLFWDGVKLIRVDSNADIFFVTLSEEFITTTPAAAVLDEPNTQERKKLAIYSIVNTIVEMGKFSRVQVYVDRQGGVGQRITLVEAGWSDENTTHLEPLPRNQSIILTPQNTLVQALDSYSKKDWTRLYDFTAYMSKDGSIKPDITDFSAALAATGNVLDSFFVTDANVSLSGQSAVVMLDYTLSTREGDSVTRSGIPVVLVREHEIWKLTYASLVDVLINVGYRYG